MVYIVIVNLFLAINLFSAQMGTFNLPHNFPTDKSFHLSYKAGLFSSTANLIGSGEHDDLPLDSELQIFKHHFLAQYQPNRKFSFGARLSFDQVTLNTNVGEYKESGLSDQILFAEYRIKDKLGFSWGFSGYIKFPFYKNPEISALTTSQIAVLGDAQTDFAIFTNLEKWLSYNFRIQLDLGYLFRTEEFAQEIPLTVDLAVVNYKFNIGTKFIGSFTAKEDTFGTISTTTLKSYFANSDYIYANKPWLVAINPYAVFWITPKFAVGGDFKYSITGDDYAKYTFFSLGLVYRWAQSYNIRTRKFKEVDINTDQNRGKFESNESDFIEIPNYKIKDPTRGL